MLNLQESLEKILTVPVDQRDDQWQSDFFEFFKKSNLTILDPTPQVAYDSWPYLHVVSRPDSTEPVTKVINWLSTRGIGMILNAEKQEPDYVFSYGMLWHFREKGQFLESSTATPAQQFELQMGTKILSGPPHESYLPTYARNILKQFFQEQGILMPRILLMSTDKEHYDLCFSLDSLGLPPAHEHAGIAEAIQWFLPQHYSIVLTRETGLKGFTSL
ncbi:MAG: hypothetical protein AB7F59_06480 [Bdellovibrionales bacterium]